MKKLLLSVALMSSPAFAQFLTTEQEFVKDWGVKPVSGQPGVYTNRFFKVFLKTHKGLITGASYVVSGQVDLDELDVLLDVFVPDVDQEDLDVTAEVKKHLTEVRAAQGYTFTDAYGMHQIQVQGKDHKNFTVRVKVLERNLQDFPTDGVVYGDPQAKVSINIFSDFQCPGCKALGKEVLEDWKKTMPAQGVNLRYFHYPLSYHQNAVPAALASECAREQNQFWGYAELLFGTSGWLRSSGEALQNQLFSLAQRADLNPEAFQACMKSQHLQARIDAHMQAGDRVQVWGTPSVFVNGYPVSDWSNPDLMKRLIQLAR